MTAQQGQSLPLPDPHLSNAPTRRIQDHALYHLSAGETAEVPVPTGPGLLKAAAHSAPCVGRRHRPRKGGEGPDVRKWAQLAPARWEREEQPEQGQSPAPPSLQVLPEARRLERVEAGLQ